MDITFNFSDKNALIVGGSRGIGAQIVKDFLEAGAHVFYISRKENYSPWLIFFYKFFFI